MKTYFTRIAMMIALTLCFASCGNGNKLWADNSSNSENQEQSTEASEADSESIALVEEYVSQSRSALPISMGGMVGKSIEYDKHNIIFNCEAQPSLMANMTKEVVEQLESTFKPQLIATLKSIAGSSAGKPYFEAMVKTGTSIIYHYDFGEFGSFDVTLTPDDLKEAIGE